MKNPFTLGVFAAVGLVAAVACSSSSSDSSTCTCSVEVNGEKKDLTCGQSACVGGFSYTCSDGSASRGGDACATASSSSGSSSSTSGSTSSSGVVGSSTSSSGASGDSCSSLATFCESKCKASQTVYKDCTKTASEGSGTKCVAWQAANANLCN